MIRKYYTSPEQGIDARPGDHVQRNRRVAWKKVGVITLFDLLQELEFAVTDQRNVRVASIVNIFTQDIYNPVLLAADVSQVTGHIEGVLTRLIGVDKPRRGGHTWPSLRRI